MNDRKLHTLFTYGTLQRPQIQLELYGRNPEQQIAQLHGFQQLTIRIPNHPAGTEYPAIQPTDEESPVINGHLLSLTETELLKTDLYEGESYKRVMTKTVDDIPCWVYQLAP